MCRQLKPLSDVMGVEVTGVDLTRPLDDEIFVEIHDAYLKPILVLFRGQNMTLPQQLDFCRLFGEPKKHTNPKFSHPDHPEVLILSNVKEDGKPIYPNVSHPIVRTHPETGRKALFLSMRHIEMTSVVDMGEKEGQALLQELQDFATKPQFVYSQRWEVGDALVWDNRCSLHRATYWDQQKYERLIYRTFAEGDVPY